MYTTVLALHNLTRWIVIILGIVAAVLAVMGWLQSRPWSEQMRKFASFFAISVDVQLLFGLLLYFTSPVVKGALQNFGAAMANDAQRFFALEHPTFMILALVFAHLGSILPKRAATERGKYIRAAIFITLAVLFILAGTPWDQPLLPF